MSVILSAMLFALYSNLDNLVIGIAYGIKKINIKIFSNLIIAFITSTGTFLAMSIGFYITNFLPHNISNALGSLLIIFLGGYFIYKSEINLINNSKSNDLALKDIDDMIEYAKKTDLDNSGDINMRESLLISFGLALNNLGSGVAASVTGISISLTVVFTFILSIFTIIIGQYLGNSFLGKLLGRYAPLLSGFLLIILGILELIN
ncbi:manganese efflux pump [Clostridium intestinale]|uniref:Sporulation protein YtaF n=1 Tax=Clostridium intestinale URNW TaxID=1294142 RepID=U2N3E8_9CLOT|nr:manganese efflux pump [Clostridium intestinale]ERK30017.1 hypothetical protein CINTURNW_2422 [Clostridium intestinale URNW]